MIDIDTIIQNIEVKINVLEKLKFDDDPKNFLYTPITAVTITNSTDFKQLECQKFVRCNQSNAVVPLEKYNELKAVKLKELESEKLKKQEDKTKIMSGRVSVQHRANYRRNSIANDERKFSNDHKSSLAGRKRRNSTKFDTENSLKINSLENGQKKPKINIENSLKIDKSKTSATAHTSSPLVDPRASLSIKLSKDTPITKSDQQQIQQGSKPQTTNLASQSIVSSKFSRSYTEFLSNLNKDMRQFKEQQKRNVPCDNFLGKDAKMFVENPILNLEGQKVVSSGSSDKDSVEIKSNENDDQKASSIDKQSPSTEPKPTIKRIESNKTEAIATKIPSTPPKVPVYGMKYLVKATKPQFEPNKSIFGKIIKNPYENAPQPETKSFNKIVMRRMTIDSGLDSRSLLKKNYDVSLSPKIQKIQLPTSFFKNNQETNTKSPEKLQKIQKNIPAVNHQKIIRLSPQKPQNSNKISLIKPKSNKPTKPLQSGLKLKIPRRNSIGYGVRIETANDIKRLKMDAQKTVSGLESLKRIQNLATESVQLKKDLQKSSSSSAQNAGTAVKFGEKIGNLSESSKDSSSKSRIQNENASKIIKNSSDKPETMSTTSIDYEDELANIAASRIKKTEPNNVSIDIQSINSKHEIIQDSAIEKPKNVMKSFVSGTIYHDIVADYNQSFKISDKNVSPKATKIKKQEKSDKTVIKKIRRSSEPKSLKPAIEKSTKIIKNVRKSSDGVKITIETIKCQINDVDQKNNNVEAKVDVKEVSKGAEIKAEVKKSTMDELTSKTMDIFRDIENYRNLIWKQSSDSNKSTVNTTKIDVVSKKHPINDKNNRRMSSDSLKLLKVDEKLQKVYQNPHKNQQNSQVTKIQQKSEQNPQNTNPQLQTSNSSSQNASQSSQSSLNSDPDTPNTTQSPQPSDSQGTSNTDQILGKRKRQINPKYSESEYMLKNTSREFTNAIRSKMMVNKAQKVPSRRQSVKPEDQTTEKLEINDIQKPEEAGLTSQSSTAPQEPQIPPVLKCEVCGKTFIKPQGLARHMHLHSGDRRYGCSKCDYRFTQRSDLMRHMLIHEGSPSIPCPKCDKKFRTEKNLQAHLETHEAPLPYKCDQCKIRFRSTKNLRYHLMSHHSGVKFQCGYCGNNFSDEKSLRTHVMQHENEDEDLDDEELEDYLDFMDEEETEISDDSDDEPMVIAE